MADLHITVEVFKRDARTKAGERLVRKVDHTVTERTMLEHTYKHSYPVSRGFRLEFHDTFVTRKSAFDGREFTERYDTPYFASPRSESYWSN